MTPLTPLLRNWRECVRDSLTRNYDRRDRDDALVAAELAASNPTNWASGG
jgi:hypothetical protein